MKRIIIFFVTTMVSHVLFGQCVIKGKVMNAEQFFIPFVTIELYKDSTFQVGTITSENGEFEIDKIKCDENYVLKIRHIGYETTEKPISPSLDTSDLLFELKDNAETFDGVVVKSKRPTIEREADRLIYYVNEHFVTGNNSAYEVLKTTPSVWVDGNGGVRINGNRGAGVMVNGKLLNMGGVQLQNYLNGLDGKDISKIEVIAVTGAEYDANSNGGVINIEMKRRFLDGYNARLFVGYEKGRFPEYETGIFSNYKKGKLTTTANFYIFQRNGFTDNMERRANTANDFSLNSSSFSKSKVNNNQVRIGADYDLQDNQNVNFEYVRTYNQNNYDIDATSELIDGLEQRQVEGRYDTESENIYNGLRLNYKWTTDTLGSIFKILSDYVHNENVTIGLFDSDYFRENVTFVNNNTTLNQLDQLSKIYSLKADYKQVFRNKNAVQAGIKYAYSDIGNDAIEKEKFNGEFIINEQRTNNFVYTESILAAYLNYSGGIKRLKYKVGLRMEDSYISGVSERENTNFDVRYLDWFPSAFLALEMGKEQISVLSLAANRQINRPFFEALNPFEYVLNEFSISRGNPSLRPEYVNNVELNYTYRYAYSIGFSYAKTENIIRQVLLSNEETLIYENQNLANQYSYGGNISLSLTPIQKVWQSQLLLAVMNNEYKSALVDELLATFYVRVNNSFQFKKNINLNLSFYYVTKELYANRIYDPYGQVDISIGKSFFNNKLNVRIGGVDLFDFQNNSSVLIDAAEDLRVIEKNQRRKFTLFVSYNFNIGKSFKKQNIESSSSGEQSRMKS